MYTISLLQHLAKHSDVTKMGPTNLSTCIAPSFCASDSNNRGSNQGKWPSNPNSPESLKRVHHEMMEIGNTFTPLVTFMIVKHREIFGDEVLTMFTKFDCPPSPGVSLEEGSPDNLGNLGKQPQQEENSSIHTNTEDEGEEEMEDIEDEEEMEEDEDEEVMSFSNQQVQKRYHRSPYRHLQLHQQSQRNSNSGTDSDSTHSVLSMAEASGE